MTTLRKILPYMSVLILVAAIYAGYTFWSRQAYSQRIEEQAKQAEIQRDAEVTQRYGGDAVKVLGFYGNPGRVSPGEKALVCYSVSNAKTVRIEPFIQETAPSLSRCLEVHPRATTTYKLTATDAKGHQETSSFTLEVGR
jgi:hypothetical protein